MLTNTTPIPSADSAAYPSEDPTVHIGLVYSIALRVYADLRWKVELDELASLGYEGLARACELFDPERGTPFSTYAYARIRGAMYDGIAKLAPIPRGVLRGSRARERKRRAGHALTPSEKRASRVLYVAPHDPRQSRSESVLRGPASTPEELAAKSEIASLLRGAVESLPERKRHLLHRHYYDDRKMIEAGAELGISKSWTSRLHAQAINDVRRAVKKHDLAA